MEANDPQDVATRDEIQMHLSHIPRVVAEGNFRAPMLIHDQVPPGVPTLQLLKGIISYQFKKTDKGGRVRSTRIVPIGFSFKIWPERLSGP